MICESDLGTDCRSRGDYHMTVGLVPLPILVMKCENSKVSSFLKIYLLRFKGI